MLAEYQNNYLSSLLHGYQLFCSIIRITIPPSNRLMISSSLRLMISSSLRLMIWRSIGIMLYSSFIIIISSGLIISKVLKFRYLPVINFIIVDYSLLVLNNYMFKYHNYDL